MLRGWHRIFLWLLKGAAGVDPGRPGLDDPEFIQVDLDAEASRSTGSGFGWLACWSTVAEAGLLMAAAGRPELGTLRSRVSSRFVAKMT